MTTSRWDASGEIAEDVGKGLVAGAVGTAAMTISSTIEERISTS